MSLNKGLRQFFNEVYQNEITQSCAEIAVITFGTRVNVIQPFKNITKEDTNTPTLVPAGVTNMVGAVTKGLDMLEKRRELYREAGVASYKPWLIMMTDGAPTDEYGRVLGDDIIKPLHERLKEKTDNRKLVIFGIGIGDNVNMNKLQVVFSSRKVAKLKGTDSLSSLSGCLHPWMSYPAATLETRSIGSG